MSKKTWISVKRGLSEDPKHRQAMGEAIWLFLHIIDSADWEKGIVYDWRDKDVAADMSMSSATVRAWRQRLSDAGYITCNQKQHELEIIIHNWTDPRSYSGKKFNVKKGDMYISSSDEDDEPALVQGDTQGNSQDDIQGDTQGDIQGLANPIVNVSSFIESKSKSISISKSESNALEEKEKIWDRILCQIINNHQYSWKYVKTLQNDCQAHSFEGGVLLVSHPDPPTANALLAKKINHDIFGGMVPGGEMRFVP